MLTGEVTVSLSPAYSGGFDGLLVGVGGVKRCVVVPRDNAGAPVSAHGDLGCGQCERAAQVATNRNQHCGVAGEEKAGLNCGTENCWAVTAKASAEDIQATLDFMYWLVTDAEVSRMLVDEFAVMPYKQAAESTCGFLADANAYAAEGNYVMPWVTNFQPNVDAYREAIVAAMNQYDNDPTDANWEQVKTAFVDGWAVQYAAANG